jgi:hypothetical protein
VGFGSFLSIGHCGGGWAVNGVIAAMFGVAFAWYVLIRRLASHVFSDLAPSLRAMVSESHNSAARIAREKLRANASSTALLLAGPILTGCLFAYWYVNLPSEWAFVGHSWSEMSVSCEIRIGYGITVSFASLFFCSFLVMLQLQLLFVTSRAYAFRAQLLFAAML